MPDLTKQKWRSKIEAKLLATPYFLSGSAALNLAKAISEFGSTTTGMSLVPLSSFCTARTPCSLCLSLSLCLLSTRTAHLYLSLDGLSIGSLLTLY